jgi:CHAT domain-containing protein/Tfp pilus assembly protein PilF
MFPRLLVALLLTVAPIWADAPMPDEGALQAAAKRAEELRRQGKPEEAVKEQARALRMAEELYGADDLRTADQLDNLARLHHTAGQHPRAESLLQRSLQIKVAKRGKDHADVALALHNLAALHVHTGQYARAEPLYRRTLEIMEATLGKDHPKVAAALDNLAALYRETGQHAQALPLLVHSLEIREARHGKDHPEVALALDNLAGLYRSMKQHDKAEPLYKRALEIMEAKQGKDDPQVATALDHLGALYQAMKEYNRAEPLYRRSLEIKEAKRGKDHPEVALALHNLATLYQTMGEYAKAETHSRRGLAIKEAELGKDHPAIAASHSILALLEGAQGTWKDSARHAEEALRVSRRHSVTVLPGLSEPEQLAFLHEKFPQRLHFALSLALAEPNLAARAAEWLLNGKSLPEDVLAERAWLARDVGDPERAKGARELRDVRLRLAGLTFTDAPAEQLADRRRELDRLYKRETELARELGRRDGRDAREDWLSLEQLRKVLPADTVFVDIARFDPYDFQAKEKPWKPARYVAWVVPAAGRGDVRLVDLGEAKRIDAALGEVRKSLRGAAAAIRAGGESKAEVAFRNQATELGELVLTPLLPHIEKASHWVFSPDGALWLAPWSALPLGDKSYVVEKYRLSHAVSGRDLLRGDPGRKPSAPAILADPDYDAKSQMPERPGEAPLLVARELTSLAGVLPRVARLPGTAREAKTVAPHLKTYAGSEPVLLLGQEATLSALQKLRSPRVLMLSTHGFFLPDVPAPPRQAETLLRVGARRPDNPLGNPLLRSGLALAGANQRGKEREGGLLTGMDAAALELRGCELVVLPACETTQGEVNRGVGVSGLRQAFQLAGARSVLTTLWHAPDRDTAPLLSDFFGRLAKGDSRPEAFRQAQLRRIESRRERDGAAHPFYWAAFTLTGQWR